MTGIVPFKTPDGHDELARRTRRLGQRHRTVLLLADGRRSADEVIALSRAAGVPEALYRELLALGLLAVPAGADTAATRPVALDEVGPAPAEAPPETGHGVDLLLEPVATPPEPALRQPADEALDPPTPSDAATAPAADGEPVATARAPAQDEASARGEPAAQREAAARDESVADSEPVARAALPVGAAEPSAPFADDAGLARLPLRYDGPMEEARELLLRAVRAEAPVAGQLTLIRLKRARDRAELESLLAEVEARIARPRRRDAAAQTMVHARDLLVMPASTAFPLE